MSLNLIIIDSRKLDNMMILNNNTIKIILIKMKTLIKLKN